MRILLILSLLNELLGLEESVVSISFHKDTTSTLGINPKGERLRTGLNYLTDLGLSFLIYKV